MAPDDFSVIAYKVLSYAYECVREGVEPSWEKAEELAKCNPLYFRTVVQSLVDSGYLADTKPFTDMSGECLGWSEPLRVTLEGVDFIENNSAMGKVKRFLGKAWEGVLSIAINATAAL